MAEEVTYTVNFARQYNYDSYPVGEYNTMTSTREPGSGYGTGYTTEDEPGVGGPNTSDKNGSHPNNSTYIKIPILRDIPSGATINSATLSWSLIRNTYNSKPNIRYMRAAYDYYRPLMGNNQPSTLGTEISKDFGAGWTGSFNWDITTVVRIMRQYNVPALKVYSYTSTTPNRSFFSTQCTIKINYIAYKKCTISIDKILPDSTVYHNGFMRVYYTANSNKDNYGSSIRYRINKKGEWYSTNISQNNDNAGYILLVPSQHGITAGSKFTVEVQRKHKVDAAYDSNIAETSVTTYSKPEVTSISVNYNPINANTNLRISWSAKNNVIRKYLIYPHDSSKINVGTLDPKYEVTINGKEAVTTSNTNIDVTSLHSIYTTPADDGKNIEIQVRVVYNKVESSSVPAVYSDYKDISTKVLYKPTTSVTDIDPDRGVNYISSTPVVNEATSTMNIKWEWPRESSPTYNSNGQNGILSDYYIELINPNDGIVKYSKSVGSKNISISYSNLDPNIKYTLRITPRYVSESTILKGPSYTITNYIMRVERLLKPVIKYPVTGTWYNGLSFRVGIEMPTDPAYESMTNTEKNNYRYGNIRVSLDNGVTYKTLSGCPTAFSTKQSNLVYVSKMNNKGVIFKPSLANYNISGNIYNIKVSVKSNYIPSSLPTLSWSVWSDAVIITNGGVLPTIGTTEGEIVKASHFNNMKNVLVNMANCYKVSTNMSNKVEADVSTKTGDKILNSDFRTLNSYIVSLATNLNNYGYSYDNDVRFKVIQDLTTAGEIIMHSGKFDSDSSYNELNYIQRALLWASEITSTT